MKNFQWSNVRWGNVIPILLICVIMTIGICTACSSKDNDNKRTPTQTSLYENSVVIVDTITLSGCEYYVVHGAYQWNQLVHKGNCINPIHYQQINILSHKVDSLTRYVLNLKPISIH